MNQPQTEAGADGAGPAWRRGAPWAALLAMVAAWLWPLGLGGKMPAGGDVTQFSLGLMAVLGRALRAGRLPLWNDLWGYGFPGLAESQMGVYYPPHLLLYGLLRVEVAYTASLLLHAAWAAVGAAWAARRFGASAWGGAVAGLAFAASGFFVIHLPHQWGYTVGSWMPWAWGLGWALIRGDGGRRTWLALAAVLAIQVLPGHFQLAFVTQVGLLGLAAWGAVGRPGRRGALGVVAALVLMVPLAAMQLGPTWQLASLAESRRDFEYLSGFAVAPLHLVSYLAPGLFHRSPLWRPLAWDAFRTSPEEHLGYVGLAPLLLAFVALVRGTRRDPATRALLVVLGLSLALSLGPNLPGFRALILLPGFSFFRAPARWGLATMLALSLLAGRGLDELAALRRPRLWLSIYPALVAAAVVAVVAYVEATFPLNSPAATATVPAIRGEHRLEVYTFELGPLVLRLVGLLVASALTGRRGLLRGALLTVTFLDLWDLGRTRPVLLAPLGRPLTDQSPILGRLAREGRGTRALFAVNDNLPMVAGAGALSAYRTLDLPVMEDLTFLAAVGSPGSDRTVPDAIRATGAAVRVLNPRELAAGRAERLPGGQADLIDDPALQSWQFDRPWWGEPPASTLAPPTFALWWPDPPAARAWLVPQSPPERRGDRPLFDPLTGRLAILDGARPLEANSPAPERVEVAVRSAQAGQSVLLTQLDYPGWRARWIAPDGAPRVAAIQRAYGRPGRGAWQAVAVPGPGDWTLRLDFDGRAAYAALAISGVAWLGWIVAFAWPRRVRRA